MPINQDQVLSALRWFVSVGGGYAVGRGWITTDQVTYLLGAAAAIVPLVFSFLAHTDSSKIKAVTALTDVSAVVVKPTATNGVATALADPAQPKVIPQ